MKKTYNSPEVFVHVLTVETVMLAVSRPDKVTEGMKYDLGKQETSNDAYDKEGVVLGKDDDIVL